MRFEDVEELIPGYDVRSRILPGHEGIFDFIASTKKRANRRHFFTKDKDYIGLWEEIVCIAEEVLGEN